jgi:hypothetical protein
VSDSAPAGGAAAIAGGGVRLAAAGQVELRVARARQRPLPLVAPAVLPHHEDLDGRLAVHAVVDALQPVIVPAQEQVAAVELGVGSEVEPAIEAAVRQ